MRPAKPKEREKRIQKDASVGVREIEEGIESPILTSRSIRRHESYV